MNIKRLKLFTRRFNKEEYTFYFNKGVGVCGVYSEWYSIETPLNGYDYQDTILFTSKGEPYTLYRYCPNWILKECKNALEKKGYKVTGNGGF